MNIRSNRTSKPSAAPPPVLQEPPVQPPAVAPGRRNGSRRWFALIAVLPAVLGWWSWDRFLRTSAYAVVAVDELNIAAPLDGLIESMRVREGGDYGGGAVAFAIVDRDTRDEIARLEVELRLVESQIAEKTADLRLARADRLYQRDAFIAERRAELGEAALQHARLGADIAKLSAELPLQEFRLRQAEKLADRGTTADTELVAARVEYEAATRRLDGLIATQAQAATRIDVLRGAIERPVPEAPDIRIAVEPLFRRAELVRQQLRQLQQKMLDREVRLPVSGRVARILRHPGEFVRAGDTVLVVHKPNSVRVVAYFEQDHSPSIGAGHRLRILRSDGPELSGQIHRIRPALEASPEAIARYYALGEPLVVVEVDPGEVGRSVLVPGAVVRVVSPLGISTVQAARASQQAEPEPQ